MATPGICVHCGLTFAQVDSMICETCVEESMQPWDRSEQEMAMSSTSVMQASVCPSCGHKMDGARGDVSGSFGPDGKACMCVCHA